MNSDFLHTGCVPYTCRQYSSMTRAHFYTYIFSQHRKKKRIHVILFVLRAYCSLCRPILSSSLNLQVKLHFCNATCTIITVIRRRHQSRTLRSFIIINNGKYDMLQNASTGCCFFYFRPCKQPQAFFTSRVIRIASVITIA